MIPGIVAGYPVAGTPPTSGFWEAISLSNPSVWLKLNEASGAVAANSGSGSDGSYNGTIAYSQGALCSGQAGANSIKTVASPAGYVRCAAPTSAAYSGVIGICYSGTGATSGGAACILWRTIFNNVNGAYLRIDQTNIAVQTRASSGGIDTGIASSVLKDGEPHLILVGNVSESPTTLRMWIDGALVWTHDAAQTFDMNGDIVIARNGSTSQYALGQYGDAFVSGGVTSAQVAAINSAWAP